MKKILVALTAAAVMSAQFFTYAYTQEKENQPLISQNTSQTQDVNTQSEKMTVNFSTTAPNADGLFKLVVSFDEMRFTVYRFALRYNTENIEPYNVKTGKPAKSFFEFANALRHTGLSRIGEVLDAEKGLIDFTGYALKGGELDETSMFEWDGVEAVTQDGVVLYEFTFRKKQDSEIKFELALADGNGAYFELFPEGASVLGPGTQYKAKAVFICQADDGEKTLDTVEFDSLEYANNPSLTKADRLKNTLYLQDGNYASAADGALRAIDKDNKAVAPMIKGDELYIPLRYVSEYFGFGVEWDDSHRRAVVRGTENHWQLFEVYPDKAQIFNQGKVIDGAKPYIHHDRIYVQARYIPQMLGVEMYEVHKAKAVVFYKGEAWSENRYAEKEALEAMQFVVSPFVKIFA